MSPKTLKLFTKEEYDVEIRKALGETDLTEDQREKAFYSFKPTASFGVLIPEDDAKKPAETKVQKRPVAKKTKKEEVPSPLCTEQAVKFLLDAKKIRATRSFEVGGQTVTVTPTHKDGVFRLKINARLTILLLERKGVYYYWGFQNPSPKPHIDTGVTQELQVKVLKEYPFIKFDRFKDGFRQKAETVKGLEMLPYAFLVSGETMYALAEGDSVIVPQSLRVEPSFDDDSDEPAAKKAKVEENSDDEVSSTGEEEA